MSYIAVVSLGKSAGSTTTAVGLSAMWAAKQLDPALIELDPHGGDLAGLWTMPVDPGLVSLVSSAAAGEDDATEALLRHSQVAPGGFRVVLAPSFGESLGRVCSDLGSRSGYGFVLAAPNHPVVVDAGRWNGSAQFTERLSSASVVIALMSPDVSGVDRARDALGTLMETVGDIPIHVAQVGERPYGPQEVSAALAGDVSLIGWDAQAVSHVMSGGPVIGKGSRRLRASMWWRSLAEVCDLTEYSLAMGSFDDAVAAVLADD